VTRSRRRGLKLKVDVEVRQGPKGRPVLMVLIGAFALVALNLVSMLFWAGSSRRGGAFLQPAQWLDHT